MFFRILLAILFLWPANLASAETGRVYLDIFSPDFKKVQVAVPYFVNTTGTALIDKDGRRMAEILSNGLTFHGFIDVLSPASYGGLQDSNWKKLGTAYTILGQYRLDQSEITIELRLFNVDENTLVLGRRYRGGIHTKEEMILKFCDEIIYQFSGEQGISRSKIAFISDSSGDQEVYVTDVLGDNLRQVTRHRSLTVAPRFSPDGRQLAYTSYHSGNANLYITDLSQDRLTRAISRRKGMNLAPAWSPDANTMAITFSRDDNPDLYLMTTKGEILERLTINAGINVSPAWSPDGRKLAFVSDRSGSPQIYIMDLKSRNVNRITFQGSDNTQPSWAPKGDWLAYTGLSGGNYHIHLIRPEGGPPVRLTEGGTDHESPSWSPDGRQIVFARHHGDEQKIYAIFRNGSGLRPLFTFEGHQSSPQWSTRFQ